MSKGRTLALSAVVLLTACHGDSSQATLSGPAPRAASTTVKRGPTPEQQTLGMVEAVTIGNSTVPVSVKFTLGSRPVIGEPLQIDVAITATIEADSAAVQSTGSSGLRVVSDGSPVEITALDPTQVYRQSFHVTPTAEGVQLLNMSIALRHDDITESRTFAVPVIVAADAPVGPAAQAGEGSAKR